MRDVLIIPLNDEESLVIASDNSGAIGLRDMDAVHVPYDIVSYYCLRVAVMECMSAGAQPFAVTVQNFCGEEAWLPLLKGINRGIEELSLEGIQINGSTESNFNLVQSAIGITVLGKRKNAVSDSHLYYSEQTKLAVIGTPLVGDEVVQREAEVAPLSVFKQLCSMESVVIMPVGSKGILSELNQLFSNQTIDWTDKETCLDVNKSSGPSTCFIIAFPIDKEAKIKSIANQYFHEIYERGN